ncbi:MAG TPA: RDD family protein [Bacilli bacterium]|jgi:hypothetical protein|nr:RDD family protein [Bacilli bacterium]
MTEISAKIETIELDYQKAKYSKRLLAFMFDMLCVGIMTSLLFLGTRAIAEKQTIFTDALETRARLQSESHLYVLNDQNNYDLITDFYASNTDYADIIIEYEAALVAFYTSPTFFDQDDPAGGIHLYNEQKIGENAVAGNYFVYADSEHTSIVANPAYSAEKMDAFYQIAIEDIAYAYLNSHPDYSQASRVILVFSTIFILPFSILVSLLVFELLFPLIFSRGRQTLGRKIFHIGLITSDAISPKTGRFLARFALFLCVEIIASVFTFGIPIIFSVSMFFFTKNNQSFPDYMLGIYSVDVELKTIYKSIDEYEASHSGASFNL